MEGYRMETSKTVRSAATGSASSMKKLYKKYSQKVYYMCRELSGSDEKATAVTAKAFCDTWQAQISSFTEEAFIEILVRNALKHCKIDETVSTDVISGSKNEKILSILGSLPAAQRVPLLVYHLFAVDIRTVAKAIRANSDIVRNNIQSAEKTMKWKMQKDSTFDTADIRSRFVPILRGALDEASAAVTVTDDGAQKAIAENSSPLFRRNKGAFIAIIAAAAVLIAGGIITVTSLNGAKSGGASGFTTAMEASDELHHAAIDIKDHGTITVAIDATKAPVTVANFIKLVNSKFYDGLTFHRIISGFMMQGGDPNGDGSGGSTDKITGEFTANGSSNNLSLVRGAIAMARSSGYNTASSQFFIEQEDKTELDGQYAVFGYVTKGMDIVDDICKNTQVEDGNGTVSTENQPVITSIKMID